MNHIKGLFNH
jgi:hypothetical protein